MTKTMPTLTVWTRRGEEAESEDWHSEHVSTCRGPIDRADLMSVLSAHHEEDLAALDTDEERREAVGVMARAYEAQRAAESLDRAHARGASGVSVEAMLHDCASDHVTEAELREAHAQGAAWAAAQERAAKVAAWRVARRALRGHVN